MPGTPPLTVDYPREVSLRALQVAYERLNSLQHQIAQIPAPPIPAELKTLIGQTANEALSVGGSNPLVIGGIAGAAAAIPGLLSGTHAARPAPASLANTSLYFETDRTVYYQLIGARWIYTAGIMFAAFALRPSDLTTTDQDFLFHATDRKLTYQWSGSTWAILITYEPLISDSLGNWTLALYNPASYAPGQQFLVTTWNVTYTVLLGNWVYSAGMYIAPAASQPLIGFNGAPLSPNDAGLRFLASDTLAASYWNGAAWIAWPTVASAPPAGPAGGDLAGTYPNPTVKATVSFTPVILIGGSATGITFSFTATSTRTGTGPGSPVTVALTVNVSAWPASPVGTVTITGVPVLPIGRITGTFVANSGFTGMTPGVPVVLTINAGAVITLNTPGATGATPLSPIVFTSASIFTIILTYLSAT